MTARSYRVHVHDQNDQGRWLGSVDFPKRPTREQVSQMAVLAKPGRYEVRINVVQGKDEYHLAGWLQDGKPFVADPGNPTDAEIAAAIKRGLADGSLTDAADWLAANTGLRPERKPVDPELFARTAPQWNCVDYPGDGPHYTPGTGGCAWCGMTREQIAAEGKMPCPTCGCKNWTEQS